MRIPSLTALRALEAVGRLGSVRQAAEELHLTRSAVSHQLRFLEAELGFPLTERAGRGIALTPRAERYARRVRRALRLLHTARDEAAGAELSGRLTVSSTPGFATYVLAPAVGSFAATHSGIELAVVTPRRLDNVTASGVDLFLAYGGGAWPDMWCERLADMRFSPVCSPILLQRGLREPRDLARFPFIHLTDRTDFVRWLGAAGVTGLDPRAIVVGDMNLALAAAVAGQGVAMGDSLVSARLVETGALVQPFAVTIPAPGAYYAVAHPDAAGRPLAAAFLAWLKDHLAASLTGEARSPVPSISFG
jgi:LysR family glycine cleavage system transcriptional activator